MLDTINAEISSYISFYYSIFLVYKDNKVSNALLNLFTKAEVNEMTVVIKVNKLKTFQN